MGQSCSVENLSAPVNHDIVSQDRRGVGFRMTGTSKFSLAGRSDMPPAISPAVVVSVDSYTSFSETKHTLTDNGTYRDDADGRHQEGRWTERFSTDTTEYVTSEYYSKEAYDFPEAIELTREIVLDNERSTRSDIERQGSPPIELPFPPRR